MSNLNVENEVFEPSIDPLKKWGDRVVIGLFLVWIGFLIGNWHYDAKDMGWLWKRSAQATVYQKKDEQEHCTVQKITAIAKQAIASANSDVIPTPDPSALKPCPPSKK